MFRNLNIPIRCILGCGLALTMLGPLGSAHAAKRFSVLYAFKGGRDGAAPEAGLIADKKGNLFGTTFYGGGRGCSCGTVFKLAPDGKEKVLHAFVGSDGRNPVAGLIADKAANLYGTAQTGGSGNCLGGCGTIYEVAPDGTTTVLYSFMGGSDGANPLAGLIADKKGNLFGTTYAGGRTGCLSECGTVFKLAPDGKEKVLYAFTGSDGGKPSAGLIADKAGNLYGTTSEGGSGNCLEGCGTVYEVAPDSATTTVLYSFMGGSDGETPYANLIIDDAGNLYGTTQYGGGGDECGVVFKLAGDGTETLLHSFVKSRSDGCQPMQGLIADTAGNLYGTTAVGGTRNRGTLFEVATNGIETVLHSFLSQEEKGPDGLLLDSAGNLYGTTVGTIRRGTTLNGAVFEWEISRR